MYHTNFNEEKQISNSDDNLEPNIVLNTEAKREDVNPTLPRKDKLNAIKVNSNNMLLNTLGMSYDEWNHLDFEEQQKIIRQYHKKKSMSQEKSSLVMIGNGEYSTFTRVKKGERVMIGSGEHSCFVASGLTLEEERIRLEDKLDDVIYNKPIALVRKIARRIQK